VRDLMLDGHIGIHAHEQGVAQRLRINLDLSVIDRHPLPADHISRLEFPRVAWLEGRHEDALQELVANADVSRRRRDLQGLTVCLNDQADYALQLGRVDAAEA